MPQLIATMHVLAGHLITGNSGTGGGSTPTPGNTALPGNLSNEVDTILGWVKWLGLAACIAGLFLVGAKMALTHRNGGGGEHMAGLGYVAGALVIIGGASAIVSFFVTGAQ